MNGRFYVYEHVKADTKEVFYVGKGCRNRARDTENRNKYWHNIVKKHGFEVRFLVKDVDEEFAFFAEKERIDQLKRLKIKICNLTDGGEGSSGLVMPQSAKDAISKIHKGKIIPVWQRKKASESLKKIVKSKEWIQKIVDSNSKAVICVETMVEYKSAKEAHDLTGIDATSIRSVCRGGYKTAGGYRWRYK